MGDPQNDKQNGSALIILYVETYNIYIINSKKSNLYLSTDKMISTTDFLAGSVSVTLQQQHVL